MLLAGCGSTSSSDSTSISAPADAVTLDVSIGTKDGPTIATATFSIGADGTPHGTTYLAGDVAASAAAATIATPEGRNRLLNGESLDQACSEIYGGPDLATVTGAIAGHSVNTSFHRANGCGVSDWELFEALIGRPRWDGDQRVVQRDEAGVHVGIGDRFSIELPANATTGFAWEATTTDAAVVREVDHRYLSPATNVVGAGGYERFSYEALVNGATTLTFDYRRPFEPDSIPAVDTARFDVQVSDAQAPTSSPGASTPIGTTTTAPEAPWASMPANDAGQALTMFTESVRALHDGVQSLLTEAAAIPEGSAAPPSVTQHAAGAVDQFYALSAMIPEGLHPEVRRTAVDVLFALGREIAPFLFAPGWEYDGWDVWASGVEDAQSDLPETLARLADEVSLNPDVVVVDPGGADAAGFHGGLDVLVVRGFGHANFDTQPPWSVRWIGGLPDDPTATTCFVDGRPPSVGAFAEQVGGCAVLYYDTTDPATHDSDLTAWIDDPASIPTFAGEVITIRWMNGEWTGIGSAE
jgi:predicted secreted protein